MTHLETTHWNLYCIKGWEMANLNLTKLFNNELQKINLPKNSEQTFVWDAAKTLWKTMVMHFKQPEFERFGTSDSDAKMALREAIQQTLGIWLDEGLTSQL